MSDGDSGLMACVKPLHGGPFEDIPALLNFLLAGQALGMQHFQLYDAGAGTPQLYRVLSEARAAGVSIEMRPWAIRERHGWMHFQTVHGEACMYDALHRGFENVITVREKTGGRG